MATKNSAVKPSQSSYVPAMDERVAYQASAAIITGNCGVVRGALAAWNDRAELAQERTDGAARISAYYRAQRKQQ